MKYNKFNIITSLLLLSSSSAMANDYIIRAFNNDDLLPNVVEENWVNNGEHTGCESWLPEASTVAFGTSITQTRTCIQKQSQTILDYTAYREIDVEEQTNNIGTLANLSIVGPASIEYQNNIAANFTANHVPSSGVNIEWDYSNGVTFTENGNQATITSQTKEGSGSLKYRLTHESGLTSEWSEDHSFSLVNDWVDSRYLTGSTYNNRSVSIGPTYVGNFTIETWVKPHKSIKSGTVAGNDAGKIDGTDGLENYIFYPSHGGDNANHGLGVSVGTNGIKVFVHSSGYLPALFVNYRSFSPANWHHITVSVNNSVPSVYVNGAFIGSGYKPYRASAFSPSLIGSEGSYGPVYADLADTRLWNKGLSAGEISSLYSRHLKSAYTTSSGAKLVSTKNTFN